MPGRHGAGAELRDLLSAAPGAIKRVTGRIGWHGQSFVLFDMTIGPDSESLRYRGIERPQEDLVKGSLDDWRTQLSAPCLASSYSTFGIAVGFAGPLLELLGQDEGGTFYLFGESSTGKTLATLTGQSVIGPASRTSLITHDITARALEEAAAAHNDLMLVLEEIDRSSGTEAERRKHVRQVGHTLAAGVGRRRSAKATQDSSLENLYWRFFSLWSGEYPFDAVFLGEARRRGEIVRLIEIPVPNRKEGGIFDRMETTDLSSGELELDFRIGTISPSQTSANGSGRRRPRGAFFCEGSRGSSSIR